MKEFIKRIWNWIGVDGVAHFALSALIVVGISTFAPVWVGIIVAVLLGGIKELIDYINTRKANGTFDFQHFIHDVTCDMVGIIVGIAIVAIYLCK